ncbi:hypothetical protein ACOMHN_034548 [Nucella lapillus]
MLNKCGVVNCKENYNAINKCRVFKIPKNEEERKKWLNVLPPRENFSIDPDKFFVCEKHWPADRETVKIPGGTRPANPPSIFDVSASCLPTQKPSPRRSIQEDRQLEYFLKKDKIPSLEHFHPVTICGQGQYLDTGRKLCENCALGSYNIQAGNMTTAVTSCDSCTDGFTTASTKSTSASQCNIAANDDKTKMIAGIVGGAGAFLLLVIVGVVACLRRAANEGKKRNGSALGPNGSREASYMEDHEDGASEHHYDYISPLDDN